MAQPHHAIPKMETHPIPLQNVRLDRFVMPLLIPVGEQLYEKVPARFESDIAATWWDMRRDLSAHYVALAGSDAPPSIEQIERAWVHSDQYLAMLEAVKPLQPVDFLFAWSPSATSYRAAFSNPKYESLLVLYNMIILAFDMAIRQLHQGIDHPIILSQSKTDVPPEYKQTRLRMVRHLIYTHFIKEPSQTLLSLQTLHLLPSDATWRCFYDYTSLLIIEWTTIRCHLKSPLGTDYLTRRMLRLSADSSSSSEEWDDDEKIVMLAGKLSKAATMAHELWKKASASRGLILSDDGLTLHIVKYCVQAYPLFLALHYGMRAALALAQKKLGETVYWNNLFKEKFKSPTFVQLETKKSASDLLPSNTTVANSFQLVPRELLKLNVRDSMWSMRLQGEIQPALVDYLKQACRAIHAELNSPNGVIGALIATAQPIQPDNYGSSEPIQLLTRMDQPIDDKTTIELPSSEAHEWARELMAAAATTK